MNIPIQDIIDKAIKEERENREKREQDAWHISSLGGCLRGVYFERLGNKPDYEFDSRTLRVFNVGNLMEDWLVGKLKTQEDIVKVETQIKVEDIDLNITGRADLLLEFRNEKILYEIKSKHSRSFWHMKKKGPQHSHEIQLWTYMYLLGIDKGKLVYVSKDDLGIMEFSIDLKNQKLKKEVFEIIKLLNQAWKEKNPLILPLPNKDSWQARYCRFHKQCLSLEKNALSSGENQKNT